MSPEKMVHSCEKPIDLLIDLINELSDKNDLILDCFMGSGSTGVACVATNRNFIGIELDDHYFEVAEKRINEVNNSIFDLWKKNDKNILINYFINDIFIDVRFNYLKHILPPTGFNNMWED